MKENTVSTIGLNGGARGRVQSDIYCHVFTSCVCCYRGKLRNSVLDWEDELLNDEMKRTELYCNKADLTLCFLADITGSFATP